MLLYLIKFRSVHCICTCLFLFLMFYLYKTGNMQGQYSIGDTIPIVNEDISDLQKPMGLMTALPLHSLVYKTLPRKEKDKFQETTEKVNHVDSTLDVKYKYILLWTNPRNTPFTYLGEGDAVFKKRNCQYTNCYVTSDREYLGHHSRFDVIAFNGPELLDMIGRNDVPKVRTVHQKYVYANIEAAVNYPICSTSWNNFFNWTWTYKLNSDTIWGYFLIKNASNHVIGPSMNMNWIKESDMLPITEDVKVEIAGKSVAIAWYVSNCGSSSGREKYVAQFQRFINEYSLHLDVFGECGDFRCPKDKMNACLDEMQSNYYFYLAFENALSEDYVTEKVLHALNHYTVPIVFGGANYSRFLPPGSYLDARQLGPQELAKKVYEIMENPELYNQFFRWRRYYSYHLRTDNPDTDDYCRFCAMLNDEELMNKTTMYENFSEWWSPAACGDVKLKTDITSTTIKHKVNTFSNYL